MTFFGQQTINGIILGSVYALYGLGFGLVMANLKIFHVAHAGVFTWGAIFSWMLTVRLELPLTLALPIAAVVTGMVNVLLYLVLVRHLLRRRDTEMAAFIASLGGLIVLVELAHHVLEGSVARIPASVFPIHPVSIGPWQVTTLHLTMVGSTAVLVGLLGWVVRRTEFGREVRAVAFNRDVAALMGVNVDRISAGVFFLSGALAGVAATAVAMAFNVISADLGSGYLIIALAAMVVGGFGSVGGILIGGLLIGLASTYATGYIDTSYRDLVVFALLLLFLVVRPNGLVRSVTAVEKV